MSEKATFPKALKKSLENMLHGKNPERNFIINLLLKLDEWLECSCEAVYHYLLRYYLEEYYDRHYKWDGKYIVVDEYPIKKIIPTDWKAKVDIVIGVKAETEGDNNKEKDCEKLTDVKEVVEIKVGKLEDVCRIETRKSDFGHYQNDICKLIRIKEKKKDIRCFLLKITHGLEIKKSGRNGNVEKISCGKIKNLMERSYEEKCKVVGEILKKELNEHLRKMSKDKKQNRCKPEEYGKYQLQLRCDSIALENRVLMYHLFEIEEQRSKVGEGSPSPDN